ncbi:hypothetical protein ABOM_006662 [Aspergillus bombycis]|uniref:Protein disulfide-isomerase n=1 Tax=Aspergillus bombycis TaxID=109264 RepID=A0A1F8A0A2_9EURO|nr:hypothetical protein ABOM_006662 [Aspergillus bombycis]OGM45140.1 hypothetical protein ABOM_006662 [Aspergillus bombycis]
MHFFAPSLWILWGATAIASTTEAQAQTPSSVLSLTKDTFNSFITQHDLVLAEFYAPWCGHCKALAPEYEKAATELKAKNVSLVKVDCTAEEALCKDQQVEGFPTLKIFRGLGSVKPYTGARKADDIISHMVKESLPAVSPITPENHDEIKNMDDIVVIGYFKPDDKSSNKIFTSIAETLRGNYRFVTASDRSLLTREGVKPPSIALYKPFDNKKDIYEGKIEENTVLNWIKTASTPLVGEINPETYFAYSTAGIPLAYIFAETKEERDKHTVEFKPLAERYKGAINIATIDSKEFGAQAELLNLNASILPAFAIHYPETNTKYPYSQSSPLALPQIDQFIQDVLDGKVLPSITSQPVPETQEGPVTAVVAHSYEELVIDNEKDVLLMFYAPWCKYCKALAPHYEELASYFADSSHVTIGKIDATANDIPEVIEGFPTIKLYPAGAKESPINYEGPRSVEDLANFVRKNGKHGVAARITAGNNQTSLGSHDEL